MAYFIGIKNCNICIISDVIFNSNEMRVIELPQELQFISFNELVLNYTFKNEKFVNKKLLKKASELKIALVGNWKMKCGISTYSENLWPQVVKHAGDFKLFIEKNDNPTGNINAIGDLTISSSQVVECWKRGESLQNLIDEIKTYDPDIVWIQHEFGLWPNAGYWLSMMTQFSNYRVIVTMHSVFHHKDKTICEAAMPEIVTHLLGGLDVLKNEKKIPSKVYVIPHGCDPCVDKNKLWNFYKSDKTFLQFGFGFRYKGWENCIQAVAILKKKYKDVFFTALFSESEGNLVEHKLYYNELIELINKLQIQDNVAIIKGYQSDETLNSYLRTNQVAIFPYISHPAHEVFGASGAARYAMSKAIPIVTSSVNHFSDLPSMKADTPQEIADVLELLFLNQEIKASQINKQLNYIQDNTWENIGLQYIKLFES